MVLFLKGLLLSIYLILGRGGRRRYITQGKGWAPGFGSINVVDI